MKIFLAVIALSLGGTVQQCSKNKSPVIPACIQQKIDSIRAQPKWNPAATVREYSYNGRTVYGFSAPCCDQYHTIVDAACNYICAPSGGFTGRGDGKCAGFAQEAKEVKVVWKDER